MHTKLIKHWLHTTEHVHAVLASSSECYSRQMAYENNIFIYCHEKQSDPCQIIFSYLFKLTATNFYKIRFINA